MVAIVDGGGEGGILNTREEERGGSRWIRWKETDELECFGVGTAAGNAVVFGDGFVESGGNIEQPRVAKLRGPKGVALADATGKIGNVFKKRVEIIAKSPKGLNDAGKDSLTLRHGVTRFLIVFPNVSSPARVGKGTLRVPLGQRVAYGGINKEFFTSRRNGKYVHNGIF